MFLPMRCRPCFAKLESRARVCGSPRAWTRTVYQSARCTYSLGQTRRDNSDVRNIARIRVFALGKPVSEKARSQSGSRKDAVARGQNLGCDRRWRTKPLGFIARDRWPQLNCRLRHTRGLELDPRPVATWASSKSQTVGAAGEARAPPVISSIDRRARVRGAGMNP